MRTSAAVCAFVVIAGASAASAQEPTTREAVIEDAQTVKSQNLTPARAGKAEEYVSNLMDAFLSGQVKWHPFWQSAYTGGGFTLGAGYRAFVSPYNTLDVRG